MKPYYAMKNKSTVSKELLDFILNDEGEWLNYYSFDGKFVPNEIYMKDKFFNWLSFHYNFRVGITMLKPTSCYTWHVDERRGVSINMLLNPDVRSNCVFVDGTPNGLYFPIQELTYEKDTYYIFDTQTPHMVLNYDSPRYLMSVEFELDKTNLSYKDLLNNIRKCYD